MAIQATGSALNYQKWHDAEKHLSEFTALQTSKDDELQGRWLRLSPTPRYLIASEFSREDYYYKSKKTLLEIFDKSLNISENLPKVRVAINNAIEDQKNIVSLRMLYAFLEDKTIEPLQKNSVYSRFFYLNANLLHRIKHCVCSFHIKKSDAGRKCVEEMIQVPIDSPEHKEMVKTMIEIIAKGYVDCHTLYHFSHPPQA